MLYFYLKDEAPEYTTEVIGFKEAATEFHRKITSFLTNFVILKGLKRDYA